MKRKAYELSVSGSPNGLFKLTDDQKPGEGDVSVLRVRIPSQFSMKGDLELKLRENRAGVQVFKDGGSGADVSNTTLYETKTNSYTTGHEPIKMLTTSFADGWQSAEDTTEGPSSTSFEMTAIETTPSVTSFIGPAYGRGYFPLLTQGSGHTHSSDVTGITTDALAEGNSYDPAEGANEDFVMPSGEKSFHDSELINAGGSDPYHVTQSDYIQYQYTPTVHENPTTYILEQGVNQPTQNVRDLRVNPASVSVSTGHNGTLSHLHNSNYSSAEGVYWKNTGTVEITYTFSLAQIVKYVRLWRYVSTDSQRNVSTVDLYYKTNPLSSGTWVRAAEQATGAMPTLAAPSGSNDPHDWLAHSRRYDFGTNVVRASEFKVVITADGVLDSTHAIGFGEVEMGIRFVPVASTITPVLENNFLESDPHIAKHSDAFACFPFSESKFRTPYIGGVSNPSFSESFDYTISFGSTYSNAGLTNGRIDASSGNQYALDLNSDPPFDPIYDWTWEVSLSESKVFTHIYIWPLVEHSSGYNTITAFKIEGSTDGTNWTQICDFSSISGWKQFHFASAVYAKDRYDLAKRFEFNNKTAYSHYKMTVTSFASSYETFFGLSNVEFGDDTDYFQNNRGDGTITTSLGVDDEEAELYYIDGYGLSGGSTQNQVSHSYHRNRSLFQTSFSDKSSCTIYIKVTGSPFYNVMTGTFMNLSSNTSYNLVPTPVPSANQNNGIIITIKTTTGNVIMKKNGTNWVLVHGGSTHTLLTSETIVGKTWHFVFTCSSTQIGFYSYDLTDYGKILFDQQTINTTVGSVNGVILGPSTITTSVQCAVCDYENLSIFDRVLSLNEIYKWAAFINAQQGDLLSGSYQARYPQDTTHERVLRSAGDTTLYAPNGLEKAFDNSCHKDTSTVYARNGSGNGTTVTSSNRIKLQYVPEKPVVCNQIVLYHRNRTAQYFATHITVIGIDASNTYHTLHDEDIRNIYMERLPSVDLADLRNSYLNLKFENTNHYPKYEFQFYNLVVTNTTYQQILWGDVRLRGPAPLTNVTRGNQGLNLDTTSYVLYEGLSFKSDYTLYLRFKPDVGSQSVRAGLLVMAGGYHHLKTIFQNNLVTDGLIDLTVKTSGTGTSVLSEAYPQRWYDLFYEVDISNNQVTVYIDGVSHVFTPGTIQPYYRMFLGSAESAAYDEQYVYTNKFTGKISHLKICDGTLTSNQREKLRYKNDSLLLGYDAPLFTNNGVLTPTSQFITHDGREITKGQIDFATTQEEVTIYVRFKLLQVTSNGVILDWHDGNERIKIETSSSLNTISITTGHPTPASTTLTAKYDRWTNVFISSGATGFTVYHDLDAGGRLQSENSVTHTMANIVTSQLDLAGGTNMVLSHVRLYSQALSIGECQEKMHLEDSTLERWDGSNWQLVTSSSLTSSSKYRFTLSPFAIGALIGSSSEPNLVPPQYEIQDYSGTQITVPQLQQKTADPNTYGNLTATDSTYQPDLNPPSTYWKGSLVSTRTRPVPVRTQQLFFKYDWHMTGTSNYTEKQVTNLDTSYLVTPNGFNVYNGLDNPGNVWTENGTNVTAGHSYFEINLTFLMHLSSYVTRGEYATYNGSEWSDWQAMSDFAVGSPYIMGQYVTGTVRVRLFARQYISTVKDHAYASTPFLQDQNRRYPAPRYFFVGHQIRPVYADFKVPYNEHTVKFWPASGSIDGVSATNYYPYNWQVLGSSHAGTSPETTNGSYVAMDASDTNWVVLSNFEGTSVGNYTFPAKPVDAAGTNGGYLQEVTVSNYNYIRIKVTDSQPYQNTYESKTFTDKRKLIRFGNIQFQTQMQYSSDDYQKLLHRPIIYGSWFSEQSRIQMYSQVMHVCEGGVYKTIAHSGNSSITTEANNSIDGRADIKKLFLDAFINHSSKRDTIQNIANDFVNVFGIPSFLIHVTHSFVDIYVTYKETVHGVEVKRRLISGHFAHGYHLITHSTAFFELTSGYYKKDSYTEGVNNMAVIDHFEKATISFTPAGGSAYGLFTLEAEAFDGTIECNKLLNRRLGFRDGPIQFKMGKIEGVSNLNDVKRIALYLEPSIENHVSSHVNEVESMAEDVLTVLSFTIDGDDLSPTATYSLSSDFNVNNATMTSNNSRSILFKVYREIYDPVNKVFHTESIHVEDHDFCEMKLVVTSRKRLRTIRDVEEVD